MFCMGAGALPAQGASREASLAQADAFLAQARPLVAAGSIDRARPLLQSALELAPDYSEALYLRARAGLSDRASTRQAMADLRRSLQEGSWTSTDPSSARQDLADLAIRTARLVEARLLVDQLAALNPEDSRNLLLRTRLLAASGDTALEERALATAAVRFPLVDEFRLLSAALLQKSGRLAAARDVIATGLRLHPSALPLLLAGARLEPGARARAAAVDRYVDAGGTDPAAAVVGLESSPARRGKYLDLFLRLGGLSRQDLVDRAVAAVKGSKEQAATLQSALARFTGMRDSDADGDGFWEERWELDSGSVTRWTREPAQDGVAQYSADFQAGMPVAFSYTTAEGAKVTLKYSRYPFLDSASEGNGETLSLAPYTLQCVFLRSSPTAPTGLAPRIASTIAAPTLARLRQSAFAAEERSPDGTRVVRHFDLSRGVPVFMEEDSTGDGVFDHRVWFENGVAVRGVKSLAGDGLFQVRETWREGRLASQAIDSDGDGKIDFRETFGVRPVRAWDYNEDGIDDSRELPGEGAATVQEFSTSLNGIFDLVIAWQGARIVSVTRQGERLGVVADSARAVTWIGRPAPPGLRLDLARRDGVQTLGARRYLLFRHDGITYAEDVK
jgi:tetratricopeptide (TPR) repeat protein